MAQTLQGDPDVESLSEDCEMLKIFEGIANAFDPLEGTFKTDGREDDDTTIHYRVAQWLRVLHPLQKLNEDENINQATLASEVVWKLRLSGQELRYLVGVFGDLSFFSLPLPS